jgi:hypothetical protein
VIQSWQQTLISATVAGGALSNTVTPTTILPTSAKITFPNNFFNVGTLLRITGCAQVSNVVTTPGTLTLDLRLGAVIVFNGGAMQMSTTAHTTLPLWYEILLTCRAIGNGTSANFIGQGHAHGQVLSLTAVADSTTTVGNLMMPNTAPAVGTGFDSTATQQLDHFATFSVATSPTNITLQQYVVESLN